MATRKFKLTCPRIAVREGETVYARSRAYESDYQHGLNRFLKETRQLQPGRNV